MSENIIVTIEDNTINEDQINVTVYENIGAKGDKGDTGLAATINLGTTSTLLPGSNATVTNSGTQNNAVLNFGIPQGVQGPSNILTITSVTTGAPGSNASVGISGSSPNQSLSFTIPRGDKGEKGDTGSQGVQGIPGSSNILSIQSVTTGNPGTNAVVEISGNSPNQSLSFTIPRGDKGEKGNTGDVGPANTLTIPSGGVTTGAPGSNATATISGTAPNQTLTFIIPRGDKGDTGDTGVSISSSAPVNTSLLWADTNINTPVYTPVPSGGLNGQSLVKVSDSDYALGWANPIILPSQVSGTAVVNADARLSDTRTPSDLSVTNAKVANNAAIDVSKLSGVVSTSILASVLDVKENTAEVLNRRLFSTSLALTLGTTWFSHYSSLFSFSANNVTVYCTTAHTGTPTVVRVGIYSYNMTDGYVLLGASSHSTNILSATSYRVFSLSSPVNIVAGNRYAVGILIVGATTTASIYGRTDTTPVNLGTTTNTFPAVSPTIYRSSYSFTGQTDLLSSYGAETGTSTSSSHWSRIS